MDDRMGIWYKAFQVMQGRIIFERTQLHRRDSGSTTASCFSIQNPVGEHHIPSCRYEIPTHLRCFAGTGECRDIK